MRALVTGAAGFVGSHLSEHLLDEGDEVLGVDSFTPYYDRGRKESNLAPALGRDGFRFEEADLLSGDLSLLLDGIDVVYHLAAQPGVRASWGPDFADYVAHNVLATQYLLEACTERRTRVVYASSSSVYGDAESLPTSEDALPRPISPYGVTKLAAEHLCGAYASAGDLTIARLRLFTVYGPRQRPDMAFSRLVAAAVEGRPFEVYGDGEQSRDFTYVSDVARAFRDCGVSGWKGVANIGGGSRTTLNQAIEVVSSLTGGVEVIRRPSERGDVRHTGADTTRARDGFGYAATVGMNEGLREMVSFERSGARRG